MTSEAGSRPVRQQRILGGAAFPRTKREADRERKANYDSSIAELRQLDSTSLADRMIDIATEINHLVSSGEFSMDPRQRDREAVRLLRVYKDSLESRALAARDTALARLGPDAPGNHLPEYAYKSTNRTALMNVPVDLRLLAAALKDVE